MVKQNFGILRSYTAYGRERNTDKKIYRHILLKPLYENNRHFRIISEFCTQSLAQWILSSSSGMFQYQN